MGAPSWSTLGLARTLSLFDSEGETKSFKETITRAGAIVGTVSYMSPEQAMGKPVDFRSDQFAFGVMLFEMLAGKRPFEGDSAVEVLAAIISNDPPSVLEEVPELPEAARELVERCLAKDADQRFASTKELYAAVKALRGEHSSSSMSASVPASRPRRSFGLLLAAAGIAALVLTVFLVSRWARDRSEETPDTSPVAATVTPSEVSVLPAVAVLGFESIASGDENRYFSQGIAEDLVERLSTWRTFKVISDYSNRDLAQDANISEVGRRLGARYVVTGSVRKVGDQVRIAARANDSDSGVVIWSERYDRAWEDLLDLQEEIAKESPPRCIPPWIVTTASVRSSNQN